MKFHAEFSYTASDREKVLRLLHGGGLTSDSPLKILGSWVALQTGVGFAMIEAKDAKSIYDLASSWADFGQLKLTPVIEVENI